MNPILNSKPGDWSLAVSDASYSDASGGIYVTRFMT
jgi:hypothetical protein